MAGGKKNFADFQEGLLPPWGKLGAVTRAKDRDSCPWIGSKKVSPCGLTHHGGWENRAHRGQNPTSRIWPKPRAIRSSTKWLSTHGSGRVPGQQTPAGGTLRHTQAPPGPTMPLILIGPPALGIYLALGWVKPARILPLSLRSRGTLGKEFSSPRFSPCFCKEILTPGAQPVGAPPPPPWTSVA